MVIAIGWPAGAQATPLGVPRREPLHVFARPLAYPAAIPGVHFLALGLTRLNAQVEAEQWRTMLGVERTRPIAARPITLHKLAARVRE